MTDLESTPNPALEEQTEKSSSSPTNDFENLPDWAKDHIKSLRKEAAAYRKGSSERDNKLSAYEKAEQEREQASLSEIEKVNAAAKAATDRAIALEAKLIERDAIAALNAANIIDADLALLAIRSKIVAKDGEATNLGDLVSELVKAKPHLIKAATPQKPVAPDTHPTSPATKQDTAPRQRVWGKI